MAAMLLARRPDRFRFAIFVAGRRPRDAFHAAHYASAAKPALPTLHVFGGCDPIRDQSHELAACFERAEVRTVPFCGHRLPFFEGATALRFATEFIRKHQ